MNKQILKYTSAVALLINSSSASQLNTQATKANNNPNGNGGPAPCLQEYLMAGSGTLLGDDTHSANGLQAKDGSLVAVAGGIVNQWVMKIPGNDDSWELKHMGDKGYIVKMNPNCLPEGTGAAAKYKALKGQGTGCDKYHWMTDFFTPNKATLALWMAESPDGKYFAVAGMEENAEGFSDAMIWKINAADGAIVWKMKHDSFGPENMKLWQAQSEDPKGKPPGSGFETVAFTEDGAIIAGGFTETRDPLKVLGFKSGGTPDQALPFIARISATDAAGSTAPTKFEWTYAEKDKTYRGSVKSLKVSPFDGNIYGLTKGTSLIKLESHDGAVAGKSGQYDKDLQSNDLQIAQNGDIFIAGHLSTPPPSGPYKDLKGKTLTSYRGAMTKMDSNLKHQWTQLFGNYPGGVNQFAGIGEADWLLDKTECWGISPAYSAETGEVDGYAMACGTGFEHERNCPDLKDTAPELWAKCQGDPRTSWRALVIKTDLNGKEVWHRMDNYQHGVTYVKGNEETEVSTSASEFIFPTREGKLVSINDEGGGWGFEIIDALGSKCTTDVAVPPKTGGLAQARSFMTSASSHNQLNADGLNSIY